jgi:hypothetical protein
MKRIDNLFEQVVDFKTLLLASGRAMRGCGRTETSCRFFFYLETEILALQQQLLEGSYRPGQFRFFTIHDPKERVIAVAPFRDRVVHQRQRLNSFYQNI